MTRGMLSRVYCAEESEGTEIKLLVFQNRYSAGPRRYLSMFLMQRRGAGPWVREGTSRGLREGRREGGAPGGGLGTHYNKSNVGSVTTADGGRLFCVRVI